MTQPVNWDALLARLAGRVGEETPPTITEVDKSMIRAFAAATGASSRVYTDEAYARGTRYGSLIAPPAFVSTFVVLGFFVLIRNNRAAFIFCGMLIALGGILTGLSNGLLQQGKIKVRQVVGQLLEAGGEGGEPGQPGLAAQQFAEFADAPDVHVAGVRGHLRQPGRRCGGGLGFHLRQLGGRHQGCRAIGLVH